MSTHESTRTLQVFMSKEIGGSGPPVQMLQYKSSMSDNIGCLRVDEIVAVVPAGKDGKNSYIRTKGKDGGNFSHPTIYPSEVVLAAIGLLKEMSIPTGA